MVTVNRVAGCHITVFWVIVWACLLIPGVARADGVFVRFRMTAPEQSTYYVQLGGFIHRSPWYLPRAVIPAEADRKEESRLASGTATEWFDLRAHAGDKLHGRMSRSGGVAEFPNVTAKFVCAAPATGRTVVIELATAPDATTIVKRWTESFDGTLTSFLVSPHLARDAGELESAAEMTARRLRWAREATGGKRVAPKQLIVQTSFWGPQRPELNVQEATVLDLLGFNVVGNQRLEVKEKFSFHVPGHTHRVAFGPAATRTQIDELMRQHAQKQRDEIAPGVPFGFTDEVVSRPPIGTDSTALAHFHQWLAEQRIAPQSLGVQKLTAVVPIEDPEVLREREKENAKAARRVFYYTSRFRQHAATERIRWHTESFHEHFPAGPRTSVLLADHPYFSGSGLGMGMTPNPTWGNYPLACDWFELGRRRAVDLIGIEDWMGLQYMYGPNTTWEGFQLMGFQAAIFRSASQRTLPTIAWITPSDETNLRLKSASALCQGAKHFFYWTYGPTATSTENYWSDLRGAYDGIAHVTRQLAAAEHLIEPGRSRKTRVAVLYSISADLWQPFGYVHMLERRGTYLSLIHNQYLVDFLCEEDIEAGRLRDYDVLYASDPCIKQTAAKAIAAWVQKGGWLVAANAAGSRDEFNEPADTLAQVFGIQPGVEVTVQPGRYHIRGALNGMSYLDQIKPANQEESWQIGALGTRVRFQPTTARVAGTFQDGSPAYTVNEPGRGRAFYFASCPALAYIKEANFVPAELKEDWPASIREFINKPARRTQPLVSLSHPVVEAGIYDADQGTALILANFSYRPIEPLQVRLQVPKTVKSVHSVESGKLEFTLSAAGELRFQLPLKLTDIVLVE